MVLQCLFFFFFFPPWQRLTSTKVLFFIRIRHKDRIRQNTLMALTGFCWSQLLSRADFSRNCLNLNIRCLEGPSLSCLWVVWMAGSYRCQSVGSWFYFHVCYKDINGWSLMLHRGVAQKWCWRWHGIIFLYRIAHLAGVVLVFGYIMKNLYYSIYLVSVFAPLLSYQQLQHCLKRSYGVNSHIPGIKLWTKPTFGKANIFS